ncbi:GNAT family N-acetyltransferase [Pseudoalteromonas luteoviolacea]|uniref:N-acetyltransferase domain-containing protein n=1 Tax=Pseudoalteromonas luteoviolacea S4054 TaxID=1129367 RepID=A0A0F6AG00_9GAMM|nr:GNAT family N-acetyltransferase [Pseudoalteromonas luteoviolacea]AOT09165.1 GCN5 family acetyltransferase [Pseudoalteromonas luteoviolacea]AOT15191.1 GCN5 family acetyltransferase [Pseudoalteromonas luteoviolacea]AOT18993.1 GCN5 family acetyltransferase [Pseudoalteromonas luteoviolacea]KKE85135.1 hypothetical protein N479_06770 [Pseudoalteromonas luteoviolacea S4054]KZN70253.1 hypothetical protein N481_01880 [Pseudoalteromonas luteoviolacea S4047-1]
MTEIKVKSFYELTNDELFEVFKLRVDIFVVEQQCPYPEIDEIDRISSTRHILFCDNSQLKAYARCYQKGQGVAAIGRVLIASEFRGSGVAYELMEQAIQCCINQYSDMSIEIAAQTYLQPFYQKVGFNSIGEAYLEDGIEHIDMKYCR